MEDKEQHFVEFYSKLYSLSTEEVNELYKTHKETSRSICEIVLEIKTKRGILKSKTNLSTCVSGT